MALPLQVLDEFDSAAPRLSNAAAYVAPARAAPTAVAKFGVNKLGVNKLGVIGGGLSPIVRKEESAAPVSMSKGRRGKS